MILRLTITIRFGDNREKIYRNIIVSENPMSEPPTTKIGRTTKRVDDRVERRGLSREEFPHLPKHRINGRSAILRYPVIRLDKLVLRHFKVEGDRPDVGVRGAFPINSRVILS